jgi:hypothetical protein
MRQSNPTGNLRMADMRLAGALKHRYELTDRLAKPDDEFMLRNRVGHNAVALLPLS